jgi:hypothetical protein
MNANVRQEALAVLTELAALAPDVRLGQLMAQLGSLAWTKSSARFGTSRITICWLSSSGTARS